MRDFLNGKCSRGARIARATRANRRPPTHARMDISDDAAAAAVDVMEDALTPTRMDISDDAAAAVVDVTEDEESAVHKVFSSAELISILVENLQSIRDRVRPSKTCRSLLPLVYNDPMSWRKFVLNGFPDITPDYLQAIPSSRRISLA